MFIGISDHKLCYATQNVHSRKCHIQQNLGNSFSSFLNFHQIERLGNGRERERESTYIECYYNSCRVIHRQFDGSTEESIVIRII